eukprot:3532225-Rhodomonas_salina.1
MGESSQTEEAATEQPSCPFADQQRNEIWLVLASQMVEGYDKLADIDMLEPSQSNSNEAMRNVRL